MAKMTQQALTQRWKEKEEERMLKMEKKRTRKEWTAKCKHCEALEKNEIGEVLAFCELWADWRNITCGDCFGNCESQRGVY